MQKLVNVCIKVGWGGGLRRTKTDRKEGRKAWMQAQKGLTVTNDGRNLSTLENAFGIRMPYNKFHCYGFKIFFKSIEKDRLFL